MGSTCEKCWGQAHTESRRGPESQVEAYRRLLKENNGLPGHAIANASMYSAPTSYCLLHNKPAEHGVCPTYTGAPDAKPCQTTCEACTAPLVVEDPASWPYCPECRWAPERRLA